MKYLYSLLTALTFIVSLAFVPSLASAYAKEENKEQQVNTLRISLNKASAEQLSEIKGLGIKKATAIVNYRQTNGPFKAIKDLTKVKGIGDKFISKNAQYLSL